LMFGRENGIGVFRDQGIETGINEMVGVSI
jgi:hypothetical protein